MSTRSYHQPAASRGRSIVLGERWTLLVIRELALGPKRYRDLAETSPASADLLAARLRTLGEAGGDRPHPPAPGRRPGLQLTERGEQLRPSIETSRCGATTLLPELPGRR